MLLMTSNTISGEASMWISRSIVPYSMGFLTFCNVWLQVKVPRAQAIRNLLLLIPSDRRSRPEGWVGGMEVGPSTLPIVWPSFGRRLVVARMVVV